MDVGEVVDVGDLCAALGSGWEPFWPDPENRVQHVESGETLSVADALAKCRHKGIAVASRTAPRSVAINDREVSPQDRENLSERLKEARTRKAKTGPDGGPEHRAAKTPDAEDDGPAFKPSLKLQAAERQRKRLENEARRQHWSSGDQH